MLRFSSSLTGDMHLENLRMALFNYILSVQRKEDLIVRIEDTDTTRNIEGKDQEVIGLLDLFGVKYKDVVYQSSNLKYHRAMGLQLLHEKIAFNCFCTPQTLEAKRTQAQNENVPYRYDDACLSLLPEDTIDNESPFTVRLRKPNVEVSFIDKIKGEMHFSPDEIDSFLILHADKNPTYNFASAVDDMIADISMVIVSDLYLSETPRQIVARAALNYTKEIEYAHLPPLLNASDEAISEHDESANVKWLLEEGFLPSAIINYLVLLGNTPPKEIFTLDEAIEWFDLAKISKDPVHFNIDALRSINTQHLALLDDVEISRYVGFADGDIGKLAKLYLNEVCTTKELKVKIGAFFSPKQAPESLSQTTLTLKPIVQTAPFFENFNDFTAYLQKQSNLDTETLTQALRFLLSGAEKGPDLELMYPFIKNYLPEIVK